MFLNENTKNVVSDAVIAEAIDVDAIIAEHADYTHEMGLAGALMMNLAESEAYHGTVESMIVAEHTSIVNEDANLLSEAKEGFVAKIKDIWSKMVKWIVGMWNKVVTFFKELCTSNKKLAEKIAKATDLVEVSVEAGYAFDPDNIGKVGKEIITKGVAEANKLASATNMDKAAYDDKEDEKAGVKGLVVGEVLAWAKEYGAGKEGANVVAVLKEKYMGKAGKQTYDVATIKKMGVFVGDHNTAIKALQASFKDLIALYKRLENYFGNLGKALAKEEGSKTVAGKAQKISSNCRKVASFLNTAIGVATDCNKTQFKLAKSVCIKALPGKAAKEDVKKSESANILDSFSL